MKYEVESPSDQIRSPAAERGRVVVGVGVGVGVAVGVAVGVQVGAGIPSLATITPRLRPCAGLATSAFSSSIALAVTKPQARSPSDASVVAVPKRNQPGLPGKKLPRHPVLIDPFLRPRPIAA